VVDGQGIGVEAVGPLGADRSGGASGSRRISLRALRAP